jgi:hypothetical protein
MRSRDIRADAIRWLMALHGRDRRASLADTRTDLRVRLQQIREAKEINRKLQAWLDKEPEQ